MEINIETEEDLRRILGQYESVRLDFKASALLDQQRDRIIKQLTEDVRAGREKLDSGISEKAALN